MIFKQNKEKELLKLENDIFRSIEFYRLNNDLDLINDELSKCEEKTNVKNYDILSRLSNSFKRSWAEDYGKTKTDIIAELERFKEENKDVNYNLFKENKIQESFNRLYADDSYGLKRYLLAVRIIMDNDYKFINNDKSFEVISAIMYSTTERLSEIARKLNQTYLSIAKKPLSKTQKGILIGLAVASLVSVGALSAVSIGGIATAGTAAGITSATILGELSLIGLTAGGMSIYNSHELRKEYGNLTVEESAFFLTLKALMVDEAKANMPDEELKEHLSDILNCVDEMKSEVEFLLFVEKNNTALNKEKITQFHNFDRLMIKVFNL